MAVHGDGYARRPDGYRGMVPRDWPSIRETSGWQPPAAITDADAKVAFGLMLDAGAVICGGRYCFICNADLADRGAPKSTSLEGVKAATGKYPEWTLSIPQGGHAPDCPVPYLLRWAGEPESPYTRVRTDDIDDAAANIATAAKSPMELAGTDDALLTPEQREAKAMVLREFGLEPSEVEPDEAGR
jgi:hypothetical protein